MAFDLFRLAAKPFSQQAAEDGCRHRAAASVAGADKQHHQPRELIEPVGIKTSGPDNLKSLSLNRHCRHWPGVRWLSSVNNQRRWLTTGQ